MKTLRFDVACTSQWTAKIKLLFRNTIDIDGENHVRRIASLHLMIKIFFPSRMEFGRYTHLSVCSMNSDEWWMVKLRANALVFSDLWVLPPNMVLRPSNTFKSISGMKNGSNAGIFNSGIPARNGYFIR